MAAATNTRVSAKVSDLIVGFRMPNSIGQSAQIMRPVLPRTSDPQQDPEVARMPPAIPRIENGDVIDPPEGHTMIALLTVLAALPIGFFIRRPVVGFVAYGLAFAHLFTFQTAQLVMEWVRGSTDAFGDVDSADWNWLGDTWGYLAFTTVVYAVGFVLVALGQRLRARRDRRVGVVSVA